MVVFFEGRTRIPWKLVYGLGIYSTMDRFPNFNKALAKFKIKTIFKETIEPEEILLDATKSSDLDEQRIEVPIKPKIFRIFAGIVLGTFLILIGQAAYMQIGRGDYFNNLAAKNRTRSLPLFAQRGIIYDKNFNYHVVIRNKGSLGKIAGAGP